MIKKDRELLEEVLENREELQYMYKCGFLDGWKRANKTWATSDELIWKLVHQRCFKAFDVRFRHIGIKATKEDRKNGVKGQDKAKETKDNKVPKS